MLSLKSGNLPMCLKASDVGPGHNVQGNIFSAYEEGNGAQVILMMARTMSLTFLSMMSLPSVVDAGTRVPMKMEKASRSWLVTPCLAALGWW